MRRKNRQQFQTDRQRKTGRFLRSFTAFVVSVLLFAAFSLFYMLRSYDYDLSAILERESTTAETTDPDTPAPAEGNASFLLCCSTVDGEAERLYFAALVSCEVASRDVSVCVLSPQSKAGANSLEARYRSGGAVALREALQAQYQLQLDRYLAVNYSGFKSVIQLLGGVEVTVPERVDYRSAELTLLLLPGRQILRGDMLQKYMQYLSAQGEQGFAGQAELLRAMLTQYLTTAKLEQAETLFTQLINVVESDVTILDFTAAQKPLAFLAYEKEPMKITIYDSVQQWNHPK